MLFSKFGLVSGLFYLLKNSSSFFHLWQEKIFLSFGENSSQYRGQNHCEKARVIFKRPVEIYFAHIAKCRKIRLQIKVRKIYAGLITFRIWVWKNTCDDPKFFNFQLLEVMNIFLDLPICSMVQDMWVKKRNSLIY